MFDYGVCPVVDQVVQRTARDLCDFGGGGLCTVSRRRMSAPEGFLLAAYLQGLDVIEVALDDVKV